MAPLKVAVSGLVHPRLEWPFLKDWCYHLSQIGISKLYLGEDRRGICTLNRRPNPAYWRFDLSDSEIENFWNQAVEESKEFLQIETIPITGDKKIWILQVEFYRKVSLVANDFDWILAIDVDELLVTKDGIQDYLSSKQTDNIHFPQIVFQSRWDEKFNPLKIADRIKYYPKVMMCSWKCIFKPGVLPISCHRCYNENNVREIDSSKAILHHFRGIEPTSHVEFKEITGFPAIAKDPTRILSQEDFYD